MQRRTLYASHPEIISAGDDLVLPIYNRVRPAHRRNASIPEREAAERAGRRVSTVQSAILLVLRAFGPLTDEAIFARLPSHCTLAAYVGVSPSSARTRRSELVNLGLVRAVPGKWGVTSAGNKCTIWEAVS